MSVVEFPKPVDDSELTWRCHCGCLTFYAMGDGTLECAQCGDIASGPLGDWRAPLPETPKEPKQIDAADWTVTDLGSSAAALRRVVRDLDQRHDELGFVIVAWNDGTVRAWGDIDMGEQAAWFDRRVADAKEALVKKMAATKK